MTRLRRLACDVWILTKGYWGSEERWSARVLLTSIIGLNLGLVGVNVLQNQANGALFTALQQQNAPLGPPSNPRISTARQGGPPASAHGHNV
jgi:ABC-type uncharacterized transport system fused permease/ATPase subunit